MHGNIPFGVASAAEIARQECQRPDKIVSPLFGRVAKVVWPVKTAAQLAAIAGTNERTASRWLSGEFDPPICIVLALNAKLFPKRGG